MTKASLFELLVGNLPVIQQLIFMVDGIYKPSYILQPVNLTQGAYTRMGKLHHCPYNLRPRKPVNYK